MENYDKYKEFVELSENSQGTAQKKYLSYSEQLEASQKRLSAAWEKLSQNANINAFLTRVNDVTTLLVKNLPYILKFVAKYISIANSYKIPGIFGAARNYLGVEKGTLLSAFSPKAFMQRRADYLSENGKRKAPYSDLFGGIRKSNEALVESQSTVVQALDRNTAALNGHAPRPSSASNTSSSTNSDGGIWYDEKSKRWRQANGKFARKPTENDIPTENAAVQAGKEEGAKAAKSEKSKTRFASGAAGRAIAGFVSGFLSANTTGKRKNTVTGEWEEINASTTAELVSRGTTAAATAVGSIWGGALVGSAAGTLMEILNKYVFIPLIDRSASLRNDNVKAAENTLSVMHEIKSNISELVQISKEGFMSFETYTKAESEITKMLETLYSDNASNARQKLLDNLRKQGILSDDQTLYDLKNIYLNRDQNTKQIVAYALQAGAAGVTAQATKAAYENKLYNLQERTNNKTIANYWGADLLGPIDHYVTHVNKDFGRYGNSVISYNRNNKATTANSLINSYKEAGFNVEQSSPFWNALLSFFSFGLADHNKFTVNTEGMSLDEQLEKFRALEVNAMEEENAELVQSAREIIQEIQDIQATQEKYYKELNEATLAAAGMTATVGGISLITATTAQLKQMSKKDIYEAVGKEIEKNGGLIGHDLYYSGTDELTGYAITEIEAWMKTQSNLYGIITGQGYTLNEVLNLPDLERRAELLQQFSDALGIPLDKLGEFADKYGDLTLGSILDTPENTRTKIQDLTSLFTSLASSTGLTAENLEKIISSFPTLVSYIGDPQKLTSEIIKDIDNYRELYGKQTYDSLIGSESYYSDSIQPAIEKMIGERFGEEGVKTFRAEAGNATNISSLREWISKGGDLAEAVSELIGETLNITIESSIDRTIIETVINYKEKLYEQEISNLQEQKDALEKINDQREYENKLIEARNKLENAQKEKKRVYRAGVGWVYEADQGALAEAQDNLEKIENEQKISELEMRIEQLTSEKENLSDLATSEEMKKLKSVYDVWVETNGEVNSSNAQILEKISNIYKNISKINIGGKWESDEENYDTKRIEAQNELQKAWARLYAASNNLDLSNESSVAEYNSALAAYKTARNTYGGYISYDENNNLSSGTYGSSQSESAAGWTEKHANYQYKVYDAGGGRTYTIIPTEGSASSTVSSSAWSALSEGVGTIIFSDQSAVEGDTAKSVIANYTDLNDFISRYPDGKGRNAILYGNRNWVFVDNGRVFNATTKPKNGEKGNSIGGGRYVKTVAKAAFGTYCLPGGPTLINEFGREAIVTPSGTITSLPANTGVVPADITKNLWSLGEIAPRLLDSMMGSAINSHVVNNSSSASTDESLNINTLTMNVSADASFDADAFINELRTRVSLTKNNRR